MTLIRLTKGTPNALFWLLCLSIALVSLPKFLPVFAMAQPHLTVHFLARPEWFTMHVISAGLALLILPFQAWKRLRTGRPTVHRWMGRTYVLACVMGGVSGIALAYGSEARLTARIGFALLGAVWIWTTVVALLAARARDFARHRAWMIRSGALTFAAVTLRLYLPFGFIAGMEINEIYEIVGWACWVPNLIVAEWVLVPRATRRVAA